MIDYNRVKVIAKCYVENLNILNEFINSVGDKQIDNLDEIIDFAYEAIENRYDEELEKFIIDARSEEIKRGLPLVDVTRWCYDHSDIVREDEETGDMVYLPDDSVILRGVK